jgi:pSer/pThr/pTyr-binding forkhead associated (FHA) protein
MSVATDNSQAPVVLTRSRGAGLELAMPRLMVDDGTIVACLRRYDGSQTVIGRHTSADLCMAYDPHISAIHASITWSDAIQAHILNDLGSANGTYLNGVRLRRPTHLNNGARIRIGLTELVYCSKLPMPGYVSTLARRVRSTRTGERFHS